MSSDNKNKLTKDYKILVRLSEGPSVELSLMAKAQYTSRNSIVNQAISLLYRMTLDNNMTINSFNDLSKKNSFPRHHSNLVSNE